MACMHDAHLACDDSSNIKSQVHIAALASEKNINLVFRITEALKVHGLEIMIAVSLNLNLKLWPLF